ncbi:PREDICTED: ras-like GTP-binding protein RhoL [Nicrophorus vespilloides]|uniref:Ras-like GTP-binding protein RhoL n=1 Tax=Nicrophorus vespilloides TaxID=110193 RepID=A0ABM1M8S8_NICVS|nr:PREDICTED: ras-like GTP-binding protein RhoL [Nicrophorus vespilloides]
MEKLIRIMVVGDGNTGKTCMLFAYKEKKYDDTHPSTVFDTYSMDLDIDGKPHKMILTDTAGQEEYDKIRVLAYKECNVFVLCYSVDSRTSFNSVLSKWSQELRYFRPKCIIILAATKIDLRQSNQDCVTEAEGLEMQKQIKANDYVECSSKLMLNVDAVFQKAVIAQIRQKKKKKCSVL